MMRATCAFASFPCESRQLRDVSRDTEHPGGLSRSRLYTCATTDRLSMLLHSVSKLHTPENAGLTGGIDTLSMTTSQNRRQRTACSENIVLQSTQVP